MYQFSHFFLAFTLFLDSCPDYDIPDYFGRNVFYKTWFIIKLSFLDSYLFYPFTEESLGRVIVYFTVFKKRVYTNG